MYAFNNKETEVRYREEIYSGGALHRVSLTINNNEISINNIKNIKISSPIIDTTADNFYVGTFVAQKVEIQFKNADNINLTGEVYLSINTKIREESGTVGTEDYDDGYEIVDIGVFLIDTTPEDYYKNAKITCYDKSILFKSNVDIRDYFDKETVVDEETGQEVEKITSVTAENLLKGLCEKFLGQGMLGTYPSLNKDRRIGSYDNTKSGKFYISMIAEIMGGNAKIGRDGKLYIIPLASRLKEFNGTNEVVLNNAKARNIETLNIDGNSYQESREGINQLMSFKEGQTSFFSAISNVTNSDTDWYKATPLEDNWVRMECDVTGASTSQYINVMIKNDKLPNLKPSTLYTIAIEFRNVDITTMGSGLVIGNTHENTDDDFFEKPYGIYSGTIKEKNNGMFKFNLSTIDQFSGDTPLRNFHTVHAGDKFSYDFRLSVLEGDYTNTDYVYEEFGASPSPDYPSEIETLEIKNILSNNLTNKIINGVEFVVNKDGTIVANGTATSNTYFDLEKITLEKGDYYYSGCPVGGNSSTYRMGINIGTVISDWGTGKVLNVTNKVEIKEHFIFIANGYTANNLVFKPMLTKGIKQYPYINNNAVAVKISGKNYFNTNAISNTNIIVSDNGKTITMPLATSGNGYTDTGKMLGELCPNLKVGDIVYLNFNTTSGYNNFIYLSLANYVWRSGTSKTITENDLKSGVVLYANRYQDGEKEQVIITDFRITKNVDDEWENYKEPITTTFDLQGNFVGKVNENTKDRLYIENGNLFLEKNIGKVVLDAINSSLSLFEYNSTSGICTFKLSLDNANLKGAAVIDSMCTHFQKVVWSGSWNTFETYSNPAGKEIYFYTKKWITLKEFKNWLSTHNTEVYYVLANPYIVDLGKITIPLFEGYNHIELLSNLETTYNGTYNVDIKETALKINALKSKTWTLAEKYKISGVTYENLDGIELVGNKENNVLYIRSDNWFLNGTLEERQSIINDLYNELKNFEMWAVKNENYGDPSLDAWDLIEFQLGNEKYYALNDNNLTYEMNISTKIETKIPSKQKQEVTNNIKKENDAINKIQQTIDQINGKITTTIEKIGTVEGNIAENSYTKKQINELIQDVEKGLINLFTTSGGNNLLTNTAPYRAISKTQLENWEGTISSIREPNSVTKYALKLLNGVASQTIELPNGIYAVGFKYKRLLEGATLKITYNGREINIDANDNITYNNQEGLKNQNGEITSYGEITNSAFTISFECSADGGFEIYELRLVHGDTVTPWTQNQNELKTTSVNIGDGITIESEKANTINKMDTNGMVVTNKTTNKETLVATDEGIITEDLTSKGKSNLSGMLVQRINKKHIFITGIMEE